MTEGAGDQPIDNPTRLTRAMLVDEIKYSVCLLLPILEKGWCYVAGYKHLPWAGGVPVR